jgi:hypothetical protein
MGNSILQATAVRLSQQPWITPVGLLSIRTAIFLSQINSTDEFAESTREPASSQPSREADNPALPAMAAPLQMRLSIDRMLWRSITPATSSSRTHQEIGYEPFAVQ